MRCVGEGIEGGGQGVAGAEDGGGEDGGEVMEVVWGTVEVGLGEGG